MTTSTKVVKRIEVQTTFQRAEVEQNYKVTVRQQVFQREEYQKIFREAVNGN